ncbi:MAG: AGE family epimerase/isomerase [Bacteroidales bacterium]|nr:AGE family epimerase/isomerase [Bacteroidales bacterium]
MQSELELINYLRDTASRELEGDILPYWLSLKDPQGGFFGEADAFGRVNPAAERGAVLGARLVWTFSAAYASLKRPEYLDAARWAFDYLMARFVDRSNGGVYWSVAADGTPLDTKKQLYAQGFAIYGLAEYYKASGDGAALKAAKELFGVVERHFYDAANGGYREALACDFSPLEDMSLSAHDINADKTMNSHLHLLEAYANLYTAWADEALGARVRELLDLMCLKIMHPSGHLQLYFSNAWDVLPGGWSYGHDIETSWLALECADAIGEPLLIDRISGYSRQLAAAGNEGLQPDGSMIYELHPGGRADFFREWWVQAEAVVGNLWAWKRLSDPDGLQRAAATMRYIQENLIDRTNGEWYWGMNADGTPDLSRPKAGFWKCPYHNSRMCLQVLSVL